MANKSKIEYVDFTWNPVTGCWGPGGTIDEPKHCFYCYAFNQARRFHEKRKREVEAYRAITANENEKYLPFAPTFWADRLDDKDLDRKKPARIFVCSMGDLFHPTVPEKWIQQIILIAEAYSHHTFLFLTKNPRRYHEFEWPNNCWLGATADQQARWEEAYDVFQAFPFELSKNVCFVSCEPLLERIEPGLFVPDWLIIGAMTGPGSAKHQPRKEWVEDLYGQAKADCVPVFIKDNLEWEGPRPREYPVVSSPQAGMHPQAGGGSPPTGTGPRAEKPEGGRGISGTAEARDVGRRLRWRDEEGGN